MWRKHEDDLEREIRSHLELEAEEQAESGMTPLEARLAARRAFGNRTRVQEECREAWGFAWLEHPLRDVRFGLRNMGKNPVYTAIAVATLALGIGANTAIFSVVRGVLLRPLDYRDPDRIVTLLHAPSSPVSPANFLDLKREAKSFEQLAAASAWSAALTGRDRPEKIPGLQMSEGMFELLGVPPLMGRWPARQEFEPGKEKVVVLSYSLWQRRFGGDRSILGGSLTLDGEPYSVIGVMPATFHFAPFWVTNAELWVPLTMSDRATQRGNQFLRVFGRLRDGVTLQQARSEVTAIAQRLAQAYPETNAKLRIQVDPLSEKVVGDVRPALLVLLGAVCFVLLIACTNMANLALARGTERRREIAIRMALGAGRARLLRQLLTESLLVAIAGGALGVLLAWWGVDAMQVAGQADSGSLGVRVPRLGEVGIDGMVLAFSAIVSLSAGVVFGVFPALQATRVDANDSLKEGGRGTSEGSRGLRLRGALVVSEVAITLVLLAGAGLLLRSFLSLRAIDGGFEADHLLTMTVSVAGLPQYAGSSREALYAAIEESVRALPGVVSASMVNHLPVGGDTWGSRVYVENQPLPKPGEEVHATYRVCRPGYFRTMGIRLAGGRDFNAHDSETGVPVILINQRLARSVWGAESAIGKRLSVDGEPGKPAWRTVVGVYRDVRQDSWPMQPSNEYYVPFLQDAGFLASTRPWMSSLTLVVRTGVDPATLTNAVKEAIWARDRNIPISEVRTMEQILGAALWRARFQMLIFSVFAAFALVLAAIGMYGVVAYSAGRRTHEIGIRMALGARRGEVIWMVLRHGLSLVGAGIGIGLVAALVVTRSMKSLLYGVTAGDPLTFAVIPAVLAAVAMAASYLPARRASGVDPVTALRCE